MIRIDVTSARPLEEQNSRGIAPGARARRIGPGDELPSVRQLAGDLGVHWNTVARAYRRLATSDCSSPPRPQRRRARTSRSSVRPHGPGCASSSTRPLPRPCWAACPAMKSGVSFRRRSRSSASDDHHDGFTDSPDSGRGRRGRHAVARSPRGTRRGDRVTPPRSAPLPAPRAVSPCPRNSSRPPCASRPRSCCHRNRA